ncbi:hypothetical protein CROQUDRAFT_110444 [Cronartium quercuum f. sp. fusiforme G11]|uniref:Arrestin C-terminal-like domain-containing protein n=1 Tax=Cronartium quercuum f. sp. fusiforme G11 TaxID=708437 RepID=A0A9P6ND28_9BASI|nr:hypothetical protein CROQUDRAFT_110444 [Cronartium quercuum f. sp. fusiforme G11]
MSQAKIFIRPPPHKTFVQGYPSIPSDPNLDRPAPHLAGTVEVRPGDKGLYASYLHIELQKIEVIPSPKFLNTSNGLARYSKTVNGKPVVLWTSPNTGTSLEPSPSPTPSKPKHKKRTISISKSKIHKHKSLLGSPLKEPFGPESCIGHDLPADSASAATPSSTGVLAWAPLAAGDFEFSIPLPQHLPPSLVLDAKAGTGISYVLRATLCSRPHASGAGATSWFRRTSSPILVTASKEVQIVRHDLHSTWPIYHPTELTTIEDRGLTMEVVRSKTGLGPGDEISSRIKLESQSIQPVKINRFEINITELVTFRLAGTSATALELSQTASSSVHDSPRLLKKEPHQAQTEGVEHKMSLVVNVHARVQETLLYKNCMSFDVRGIFPESHSRLTISSADHLSIQYFMRIRAVLESTGKYADRKKLPKELIVADLPVTIGDRDHLRAQATIEEIGPVPSLCLSSPGPPQPPSDPQVHIPQHPATSERLPSPVARRRFPQHSIPDRPTQLVSPQMFQPSTLQHPSHSVTPQLSRLSTYERPSHSVSPQPGALNRSDPDRGSHSLSPQPAPSFTGIGAGVGVPFRYPTVAPTFPKYENGPRPYLSSNPRHSAYPIDFLDPPRPPSKYTLRDPTRNTWGYRSTPYHSHDVLSDGLESSRQMTSFRTTRSTSQPAPESVLDDTESSRARSVTPLQQHPAAVRYQTSAPATAAAVDEKALFMRAKAEADRVQSMLHSPPGSTLGRRLTCSTGQGLSTMMVGSSSANGLEHGYVTAEEDKRALDASIRMPVWSAEEAAKEVEHASPVTIGTVLPLYGASSGTPEMIEEDTILNGSPNHLGLSMPPDSPTFKLYHSHTVTAATPGDIGRDPLQNTFSSTTLYTPPAPRTLSPPPPPVNLMTRPSFFTLPKPPTPIVASPPPTLIDPQRIAYLRAVAEREAYFSDAHRLIEPYEAPPNKPGAVASALEEKERLKLAWEAEQQRQQINEPTLSPSSSGSLSSNSTLNGFPDLPSDTLIGEKVLTRQKNEKVEGKRKSQEGNLLRMPTANRVHLTKIDWVDDDDDHHVHQV